ncbi:uncharacterized protein LOC142241633 [Haematobia irritans]|uniref:uncharacterized protein LOC142241633 n=1 Tax=Haematobia irritans TaxID=7368 RepID=UPI003F4FA72A
MCCTNMRTLSFIVGWIHLIFALIISITLLIHLCTYHNATYDDTVIEAEVSKTGLPTLIFLFIFSVTSLIIDILLLKGISQERHKLMTPFVFGNYVAMGIQSCLTLYNIFKDIIEGVTFGDLMIHLILNCLSLGLIAFFFYPIYQMYHQIRLYNQQRVLAGLKVIATTVEALNAEEPQIYVN